MKVDNPHTHTHAKGVYMCAGGCLWIYVIQKLVLWVKRCVAAPAVHLQQLKPGRKRTIKPKDATFCYRFETAEHKSASTPPTYPAQQSASSGNRHLSIYFMCYFTHCASNCVRPGHHLVVPTEDEWQGAPLPRLPRLLLLLLLLRLLYAANANFTK